MEAEVDALMADFDARIAALAAFAEDQNAIVGLCTSGSFNVLGSDGRCSMISVEIGFDNLGDGDVTSTHGNESSFELIVELNPDYIFVLDRDAAIATEGAKLAQEIVENELVMETDAYKNGHIVYQMCIRDRACTALSDFAVSGSPASAMRWDSFSNSANIVCRKRVVRKLSSSV